MTHQSHSFYSLQFASSSRSFHLTSKYDKYDDNYIEYKWGQLYYHIFFDFCYIYSNNKIFPWLNIFNSLLSLHRLMLVYNVILQWFASPKYFFMVPYKRFSIIDIFWVCVFATLVRQRPHFAQILPNMQ